MVLLSAPATYLLTRARARGRPHDGTRPLAGVDQGVRRHPVLRGVDLDVPARQLTAVLGPSGCGKTTLLRLVAGFDDPDAGTIALGGETVAGAGRPRAAAAPPGRLRAAGGRAVPAPVGRRERRLRAAAPQRRARPAAVGELLGAGRARAGARPPGTRTSCPAASSSGSRWPGRWPRGRRSCCSTSRSPRWTPACASRPGGRWPTRWPRPGRPRCWSPTTRPRRCRWPTRSR